MCAGFSLPVVMRILRVLVFMLLSTVAWAASKPHVVALGKAVPVKLLVGTTGNRTIDITVRPLYVDTKLKEFTTGKSHDVTDREYVIRQAYRINDSLPDDSSKTIKWLWQRGGYLRLPDFDPLYSDVSWYRDYAAYCGIAGNGERVIAVVAQIGVRKPLYRKDVAKASAGDLPDSDCAQPHWERQPARVTFLPKNGERFTVNVSGRFADQVAGGRTMRHQEYTFA